MWRQLLIGLTTAQIAATHWDTSKPPTFVGKLVGDHLKAAEEGRARIRDHADGATEAELRPLLKAVDAKLEVARLIGDGVVSAFFYADKPKERIKRLVEFQKAVQSHLGSSDWVNRHRAICCDTEHAASIRFGRSIGRWNSRRSLRGRMAASMRSSAIRLSLARTRSLQRKQEKLFPWLQTLHEDAHGNADLVAHFFRRAFGLLRRGGVFGLIATNTIGQGDTRRRASAPSFMRGGAIPAARRRLNGPARRRWWSALSHV